MIAEIDNSDGDDWRRGRDEQGQFEGHLYSYIYIGSIGAEDQVVSALLLSTQS